jgi:intein/homing endonuclease
MQQYNKPISDLIKQKICQEYLDGARNVDLCLKYNISRSSVQNILKRNKVPQKSRELISRKHHIKNFTGEINNHNDTYILGLIWADGNLSNNCVSITLNHKDKKLLTDISKYVYGYEHLYAKKGKKFKTGQKIYTRKKHYTFAIHSTKVSELLQKIGLCENKSLKIQMPIISESYFASFIRGLFDGDGCIYISKCNNKNKVTITTNPLFCKQLQEVINRILNINVCISNTNRSVYDLTISGNLQIVKFMNWIYSEKDCAFKMERKYKKFINAFKKYF